VAPSYIQETAAAAGGAAEIAAARKHPKYKELEGRYTFGNTFCNTNTMTRYIVSHIQIKALIYKIIIIVIIIIIIITSLQLSI